jgi:hypothetical protein
MLPHEVIDASEGMSPVHTDENAEHRTRDFSRPQSFASILGTPRYAFTLGERS